MVPCSFRYAQRGSLMVLVLTIKRGDRVTDGRRLYRDGRVLCFSFFVLGSLFVDPCSWILVPGSWFMVPGSWFMVPCSFRYAQRGS